MILKSIMHPKATFKYIGFRIFHADILGILSFCDPYHNEKIENEKTAYKDYINGKTDNY